MSKKPQWVEDDSVTACKKCKGEFTLFNRRHHCRACGRIFCGACSAGSCVLPEAFGEGDASVRVCDKCFAKHASSDEKKKREEQGDGSRPALAAAKEQRAKFASGREERIARRKARRERLRRMACIGGLIMCCCGCCL